MSNRPATKTCSEMVSSDFDPNQCCVCFRIYEEDVLEETKFNWIKCVCERWVHERTASMKALWIRMEENLLSMLCTIGSCVP